MSFVIVPRASFIRPKLPLNHHNFYSMTYRINYALAMQYFLLLQENGYQISFEDTCPGNHYCVSQVMMTTGEADIPYTITSFTKKNPSDECIEFGIMKVKNSWNAKSVVTSSTSKGIQFSLVNLKIFYSQLTWLILPKSS